MRLRSTSVLVGMGLWLTLATPVRAEEACELAVHDVPTADAEAIQEALFTPKCRALERALIERLDALLDAGELDEDLGPEEIAQAREWLALMRARLALSERDPIRARTELAALTASVAKVEHFASDDTEPTDDEIEERAFVLARVDAILAVLDGRAAFAAPTKLDAPAADWTLSFGSCGTPAAMFHEAARMLPGAADAWIAVGRPELGLQQLLVEQWVDAVGLGMVPPRLREFSDLAFGAGAYEREVERGLTAIRIVRAPDGLRAWLPIFGLDLPVPMATQSWQDKEPHLFSTEQEIADFMRGRLLPDEEF